MVKKSDVEITIAYQKPYLLVNILLYTIIELLLVEANILFCVLGHSV